jgi:hypothetical protein
MVDDVEKKRSNIGVIPISKLSKSPEWRSYSEASKAFSLAKEKSLEAKQAVRELLRKKSGALSNLERLEFTVIGDHLQVFERKGRKSPRSRSNEIELN